MSVEFIDPLAFHDLLWPNDYLYDKQRQMVAAVLGANWVPEVHVKAANKAGKDYGAAKVVLLKALRAIKLGRSFRIITTSVKEEHINVLWGEIGAAIQRSAFPLLAKDGGPLIVNNLRITYANDDQKNPLSYIKGMVAGDDMDALAGHHAEETLGVGDEASGLHDLVLNKFQGWAKSLLFFGNPNPCDNFFRRAFRDGELWSEDGTRQLRKLITISAEDSPNVKMGRIQSKLGLPIDPVVPGVISFDEFLYRKRAWDKIRQCIGLNGEFYEGAELLLFPPDWLDASQALWPTLPRRRPALAIGVDPAEGGDKTTMAAVDGRGLIELTSKKTPNTMQIVDEAIRFAAKHGCPSEDICFDAGGGGHQLADRLRQMGHNVRTVAFGERPTLQIQRRRHHPWRRRALKSEQSAYFNRRAEMYGELSEEMDTAWLGEAFAIPPDSEGPQYAELRRQLSLMPRAYDAEQKLKLPPKQRQAGASETKVKTLIEIIGHSPDEADALAIAMWAMNNRNTVKAGAAC